MFDRKAPAHRNALIASIDERSFSAGDGQCSKLSRSASMKPAHGWTGEKKSDTASLLHNAGHSIQVRGYGAKAF